MKNQPTNAKILVKAVILLILILINISFLKFNVTTISEEVSWNSGSELKRRMDADINEGEYAKLGLSLGNAECLSEEYNSYFEVLAGYHMLYDYKVWKTSPENTEKAEEIKERLVSLSKESIYEKNQLVLKSFVDEAEQQE